MRLRPRIASLAAVAVMAGGVANCAPAAGGASPRPAAKQAAIVQTRPPATPSRPRPSVSPVLQVTGAPGGVKAKAAAAGELDLEPAGLTADTAAELMIASARGLQSSAASPAACRRHLSTH